MTKVPTPRVKKVLLKTESRLVGMVAGVGVSRLHCQLSEEHLKVAAHTAMVVEDTRDELVLVESGVLTPFLLLSLLDRVFHFQVGLGGVDRHGVVV